MAEHQDVEDLPIKINYNSYDIISSVKFSPATSKYLLVTSWDNTVTLCDTETRSCLTKYDHTRPVLDAAYQDTALVFSGGTDNIIKRHDFIVNKTEDFGKHELGVKCVLYSQEHQCVLSGSWDHTVKLWDPRNKNCLFQLEQPERVNAMDLCNDKFIVGTSGRDIWIWDFRRMEGPLQCKSSKLEHLTTSIRTLPDMSGYAISGTGGRVSVEFFDQDREVEKLSYDFKCHRMMRNLARVIYPVNALSFNKKYGSLATGGSDRYVYVWDIINQKCLTPLRRFPSTVSSLEFSNDNRYLAVGCSTLFEEETELYDPDPENGVFLRKVDESSFKPDVPQLKY